MLWSRTWETHFCRLVILFFFLFDFFSLLICIASNNANHSYAALALSVPLCKGFPQPLSDVVCSVLVVEHFMIYRGVLYFPCLVFGVACTLWNFGFMVFRIFRNWRGGIIPSNVLCSLSVDINRRSNKQWEADPYLINALLFLSTFHWILCITFSCLS